MYRKLIIAGLFLLAALESESQNLESDSLLEQTLREDSIFLAQLEADLASDSLSIFQLIDSLLKMDSRSSMLSMRFGYTSHITNAGRDLGVNQFGFNGGLTYYHKSGIFGDLSGFWNSEYTPRYSPTITTLGYLGNLGKKYSFITSFDHYFFSQENEEIISAYSNAINISQFLNLKHITPGIDYSFLFGGESAHRFRGYLSGNLIVRKAPVFDRISFTPTFSMLFGNQTLYYQNVDYRALVQVVYRVRRRLIDRNDLGDWKDFVFESGEDNVYGLMNYGISLPLYLYLGNWNIALNYNLNIPVELPGEDLDLSNNGFFSVTVLRSISL